MNDRVLDVDIALLRRLGIASLDQLPKIFAHKDNVWNGRDKAGKLTRAPARIDSNKNLHMPESDLLVLKTMLPIREVGRVRADVTEFAIDIAPHHLLAGAGDKLAPLARGASVKPLLRGALGHDPHGRAKKPRLAHGHADLARDPEYVAWLKRKLPAAKKKKGTR